MSQFRLLVMCTANQCRSPMGQAIAAEQLRVMQIPAIVKSCGVMEGGEPAASGAVRAMKSRGLDISGHVSSQISPGLVKGADLILTMERRHLSEVASLDMASIEKAFVLRELASLATQVGHRFHGTEIASWVAQAHRFRGPSNVLSFDTASDLHDPMGGSQRAFNRSAGEISDLLTRVWTYLFPTTES